MARERSLASVEKHLLPLLAILRTRKFGVAAFLFPLVIRLIPEIIAGQYPIGYDTISSYVPFMLDWGSGTYRSTFNPLIGGWLVYAVFGITYTATRIDPIIIAKIAAPILYGFLGFSEFVFARRVMSWTQEKSLVVVFIASLDFIFLRFSWDLFRNTLGLALLLTGLAYRTNINSRRKMIGFAVMAWSVVVTHLLVGVVLIGIICLDFLSDRHSRRPLEILPIVPAGAQLISSIVGLQGQGISVVSTVSPNAIVSTSTYVLYLLAPVIPLALLGQRSIKSRTIILWTLICLIGVLSGIAPVAVSYELVTPERWVLMLGVPVLFYAVEGLSRFWTWSCLWLASFRGVLGASWLMLFILLGGAFILLPASNAFPYFSNFTPTSMLQSSVPLEDSQSVASSFSWLSTNIDQGSVLMAHHAMYGWARVYFHAKNPVLGYSPPTTLQQALLVTSNLGYMEIYTVWWIDHYGWYGEETVPACFHQVHQEGRIGVFLCIVK